MTKWTKEFKTAYNREYHKRRYAEDEFKRNKQMYAIEYYTNNTHRVVQKSIRYKREVIKFLNEVKHIHGCCFCGKDSGNLHFHHVDKEDKCFNIGEGIHCLETIREEAAKCIVLCASCHKTLHHSE